MKKIRRLASRVSIGKDLQNNAYDVVIKCQQFCVILAHNELQWSVVCLMLQCGYLLRYPLCITSYGLNILVNVYNFFTLFWWVVNQLYIHRWTIILILSIWQIKQKNLCKAFLRRFFNINSQHSWMLKRNINGIASAIFQLGFQPHRFQYLASVFKKWL